MSEARSLAFAMPSESQRWDSWRAKGRADDLRLRRRLSTAVIDVAAAVALGVAIWRAFQF